MRKLWLIFYFIPVLFAKGQRATPPAIVSGPLPGLEYFGKTFNALK
jgi:hypothetical protein